MIRSILVPLDASPFGEHALPTAAALARRAGAPLHLVHVHEAATAVMPAGVAIHDVFDLNLFRDEHAYLAALAGRVREEMGVSVKASLLEGEVAAGLKAYAEREGIDLVVMSTHARGPFARFWLGSVADDLAHELIRPVLLVPPHEGEPAPGRADPIRSIVVPLDGTPLAERAVDPAVELALLFDAELHLVRVNRPVVLPGHALEGSSTLMQVLEDMDRQGRVERDESCRYLDAVARRVVARGVRVGTHVVVEQEPAEGILEEARADRADLIAMESHGRRGLARLFRGSVADRVVRRGEVPVLVHHAAG